MILLDTDHFSVLTDERNALHGRLMARLNSVREPVAIPIVSVEEQFRAWMALLRRLGDVEKHVYPYDRLIRLVEVLGQWEIARWSQPAVEEFKRLRKQRIRIGTQDLKIASIAIANDAQLLSSNRRDFERVPGLKTQDWLYGQSEVNDEQ
jgi:tRNA(fMet)-specific endonuclease VapC